MFDRDEWVIDREAIASFLVEQFRRTLKADRDAGLSAGQTDRLTALYRESEALQQVVDAEIERLAAHLSGRVH